MSRLNQEYKEQTEKEIFLEEWDEPYYYGFSSWKEYLKISLDFFNTEFKNYNEKIKEIDKIHKGKFYETDDDFAGVSTIDGHDVYEDDMIALSVAKDKVLPLILMGIYTDFEKTLIGICNGIREVKPAIKPFNGNKITECKDYLFDTNNVNLIFSETLKSLWDEINNFRELRNVFAHDNPIDIVRKKGAERLDGVKNIKDISVNGNNWVSFDNENPLIEFIKTCDGFIGNLIEEIANKIYE
jgi:hypothetical protein